MKLPVDIIPEILFFVEKPVHLVAACLVNHIFYRFALRLLYHRIVIHSWHKRAKHKAVTLFSTLACHPELACLVHHLEIRDFPKHRNDSVLIDGLRHCANLRSCTWTRDGTLTSDMLEILSSCQELRELEINGNSNGNYDHNMLLRFRNLKKLSIIMPSESVVSHLHDCFVLNAHCLRSLTLICRATPLVTDDLLESMASLLSDLDHFHIVGCPRLEYRGIWALISTNKQGLLRLGLEGLSQIDLQALGHSSASRTPHPLRRLRSIILALPLFFSLSNDAILHETFTNLMVSSSLERFQISMTYRDGPGGGPRCGTESLFCKIAETNKNTLRRFSIHDILVSFDTVQTVCTLCQRLEELFVTLKLQATSLGRLATALSPSKSLRTVHVNNPGYSSNIDWDEQLQSQILMMVSQCSFTMTRFGWNYNIWEIKRTVCSEDAAQRVQLLNMADSENPPDVPEQFLVVRT